jgi:polysaccharide export outer membrane protein
MKYTVFFLYRCGQKFLVVLFLLSMSVVAFAQQQNQTSTSIAANNKPIVNVTDDTKEKMVYRIGAGDVLDIKIFPRTQLSIQARVAENGYIRLLMIDQPVMAACKTETELGLEIAELYKKYQRNPSVSVFIVEYNAIRVGVVGSVEHPSQFLLKRPMRLLDVVSNAGGPNKEAGNRVVIAHTGAPSICEQQNQTSDKDDVRFTEYSWRKIQEGDQSSNPYLKPGDIVTIPRADEVFVVGNVFKPQAVIMREPLTLRQAIAAAGGDLKTTKKNQVKVIRQTPGSTQPVEFIYDLVAIDKGKIPDPFLQANDIITVPEDSWKAARKKIIDALTSGISSIPVVLR